MFQATGGEDRGNADTSAPGLEISALSAVSDGHQTLPGAGEANECIGPYRLLELIGCGGMGEVWLAEQTYPVHRRVAIKLIKAGMDTLEVVARFYSERQALALMNHTSIAKVFDAGATPEGRPYFAMEYISGVPITEYCDDHRLTIRERLELFVQVCEAVQHAHQKAIIHRDLKPSNILVEEVDSKPVPRVIDFGVAKAIAHGLIGDAEYTRTGVILGTPTYMSPEQAGSVGIDVDTRADVYSLGAVLYELLVGVRPFDFQQLPFDEMLRRLREQDAVRPSTKLQTSYAAAENWGCDVGALTRQLRGDLDAITLKALAKERSRRYGSPSDLAADIGRYLRHEAVLAVPPSLAYRARKFAWRYRAVLAAIAALILVLVAAAIISIRQSIIAVKQRDRADAEAATAQAVNDFLQNDLLAQASAATQSNQGAKPDPDLKVRTALDRAAARMKGKFDRQPEVEAAIRETIGETYSDLGLYLEARKQRERALDLRRRVLGAKNPTTLKSVSRVGRIAELQGRYAEAESLLTQALKMQRNVLRPDHPDLLYSMNVLANTYDEEGKYAQAEGLHSQILEIRRRALGPEHPDTLNSMNSLALVYYSEGNYARAEMLYGQALEISRRVLGTEHPDTLKSMNNLAGVYYNEGKYPQSEALFRQSLEIKRRVLGPEHPDTLRSMGNLASVYDEEGRYAQAEALDRQTLEIERRVLRPEHPLTLIFMDNLANAYRELNKYTQAEALYEQTLEISRRALGREHPFTLSFTADLAYAYQREGKYALAETYAAQVLASRRHALGSEHPDTMASVADLALAYVSQGRFRESEPLAREVLEFYRTKQADNWQHFRAETLLGASLAGQKKFGEAEALLVDGYRGMMARKGRIAVPDWYHLDRAREWIIQLYRAWGKPEKAAEWSER